MVEKSGRHCLNPYWLVFDETQQKVCVDYAQMCMFDIEPASAFQHDRWPKMFDELIKLSEIICWWSWIIKHKKNHKYQWLKFFDPLSQPVLIFPW